jgi:anti-sigma28 factor (negative regulator of flagellin synthesis)
MSAINGIGSNHPVQKIATTPVMREVQPTALPKQLPLTDRVELSGVSHLLATLKANDIRADKVQSVRAAIDAGTYETSDKMDAAIDKLLNDLT